MPLISLGTLSQQEVASPSSVKRKQDSDENGQESGSDLAEEDLRKARQVPFLQLSLVIVSRR